MGKKTVHKKNINNKTRKLKYKNTKKTKTIAKTDFLNQFTLKHFDPISDVICSKHPYQSFEEDFQKLHPELLTQSKHAVEQILIKLLHKKYMPNSITPRNDFYTYINYTWIRDKTIKSTQDTDNKKYFVEVDSFRIMQNKVYYQLMEIIKEYIKTNKTPHAIQVSNVYNSFLNLNPKVSKKHIQSTPINYEEYIQKGNLLEFLAHINSNLVVSWASPIRWKVLPDQKNPKIFRAQICGPELSLYDYSLLLDDIGQKPDYIKYKHKVKSEFLKFITKIFDTCYGIGHGFKAQDVFDIEYELLIAMGCESVKKDSPEYYNVVKSSESMEKYGFDFPKFAKCLGYKTVPDFFICDSLSYLKCITKILEDNWKTPKWASYWNYIYLRQIIRFDKNLKHIYYDFHGKFINGQPDPFPSEIFPVFGLSITFNTFLSNEYINKYRDTRTIAFAKALGDDLLTIFKRIIGQNKWLSAPTKKYALLKLEHLKYIIGHTDDLAPDPMLDYDSDDAWGNILKIATWKTTRYVTLTDKPVFEIPIVNWNEFKLIGKQCYIVNAFYTPVENSIYIPLAYLQKPFVDLDQRGIEYNLAHLGDTLGHEMSHALDNSGSKYDWKGNLYDWWTPADKKKYNIIIKDIVKQYEFFAKRDGIDFDASIGIGEDMADISGISICEEYLRDFQRKNKDIIPIRSASFQAFYTYYAVSQQQFIYKKALSAQLKTNPHPLDKYRTNIPLSRLELFRSLYNVQKGDNMWWHSTNTIW